MDAISFAISMGALSSSLGLALGLALFFRFATHYKEGVRFLWSGALLYLSALMAYEVEHFRTLEPFYKGFIGSPILFIGILIFWLGTCVWLLMDFVNRKCLSTRNFFNLRNNSIRAYILGTGFLLLLLDLLALKGLFLNPVHILFFLWVHALTFYFFDGNQFRGFNLLKELLSKFILATFATIILLLVEVIPFTTLQVQIIIGVLWFASLWLSTLGKIFFTSPRLKLKKPQLNLVNY